MEEKLFDYTREPGKKIYKRKYSNNGKPLISIITAYYNSAEFIHQTANSVFNQTFPYWEWIIMDDGSTDNNTKQVLEDLAKKDKRIKIFTQKNGGPARARMNAISKSKTDLIFILDSDDMIVSTFLEKAYWSLMTNPDYSWVYCDMVNFGDEEFLWKKKYSTKTEKRENIICGNSLIKKQDFIEVGGYDLESRNIHEDWNLWLKMLSFGKKPIKMEYYGFWYRKRVGSVLSNINKTKKRDIEARRSAMEIAKKVSDKTEGIQFPDFNRRVTMYHEIPYEFDWDREPVATGNKKRLLFILPWFTLGGADKFNIDLINGLHDKGYEITVVTTEISEYVWRQKINEEVELFDLNTFLNPEDWASFLHYLINSRKINLVFYSNSYYGYYVLPWLKYKFPEVPFVDYIHAEDFSWRNGGYPRDSVAISKFLDKTYTCNQHVEKLLYSTFQRKIKSTKTIYIGVDHKQFDYKLDLGGPNFNEYKNKKIILFVTRMIKLKRPIFMLEVLKELIKEDSSYVLFMIGDGEELKSAQKFAAANNLQKNVVFWGSQQDVRPFYKIANVLVIPSLTEGITITTYEALSMGVPVVSSDVGGQKEIIDNDTGIIIKKYQSVEKDLDNLAYDYNEIKEFVTAINKLIVDKKNKEVIRNKILKVANTELMIDQFDKEFINLIKKGSQVRREILNNEELYINYLLLYFNINTHKSAWADSNSLSLKDRLWRHKSWRVFIRILQFTGIIKGYKYIVKKIKSGYL